MMWKPVSYLIDTENVGNAWISLLPGMSDLDRIYLLCTDNSPDLSPDDLGREGLRFYFRIFPVRAYAGEPGRSALDFQLVSLLGSLIANDGGSRDYAIVSNDRGYDPVAKFWADRDVRVSRVSLTVRGHSESGEGSRPKTQGAAGDGSREEIPAKKAKAKRPAMPYTGPACTWDGIVLSLSRKQMEERERKRQLLKEKTNVPREQKAENAVLDCIGEQRLKEKELLRRLISRLGEERARMYFGTVKKILPELYENAPAKAESGTKKKKKKKKKKQQGAQQKKKAQQEEKQKSQGKTAPAPANAREARRKLLEKNTNISREMEYVLDALEAAPSGAKEDVIIALAERIGEHNARCCVGMFKKILPLLYPGKAG